MEFLNIRKMQSNRSRRIFLAAASAFFASLVILKKIWPKKQPARTAKFLTQDGTLVEVPVDKLPQKKVAITTDRLVSWIWKDQKL